MIFSINLEIDLTDVEIKWLKDKFLPNRRSYLILQGGLYRTNSIVKTLSEKNIIVIDNLSNANLTEIGHKILDLFDRDKKITDLLNEN
jgi:hypothetical protein